MFEKRSVNQEKLRRFRNKHRLRRVFFVFVFFLLLITFTSLSYVVAQVVAANVGLSVSITGDPAQEVKMNQVQQGSPGQGSSTSGNSSGSSGNSSATIYPSDNINTIPMPHQVSQPAVQNVPTEFSNARFVLSVANTDRSVPLGGTMVTNGNQSHIPIITSNTPMFYGNISIPHALIRIAVSSEQRFSTVIMADATGSWEWQPPEPLLDGEHHLVMMVYSPDGEYHLGEAQLEFLIDAETENESITPNRINEPIAHPTSIEVTDDNEIENVITQIAQDILFDVRIQIPESSKYIQPGEDVSPQIALINFTRREGAQDVSLTYTIFDSEGNEVLKQSETVAVATQLLFIKNFRTSLALKPGEYKLQVELPSSEFVAVSTDTFTVGDRPQVVFPGSMYTSVSLAVQALIGLVLLFFLILYLEFRRYDSLGGFLRGLTEEDLKKLGYIS